jgi:hypothetical protein
MLTLSSKANYSSVTFCKMSRINIQEVSSATGIAVFIIGARVILFLEEIKCTLKILLISCCVCDGGG